MGKDWIADFAPFAALAAAPVLAPGASGAVGSGLLGTTPYAAPSFGAFGSAGMLDAGAAGLPALGSLTSGAAATSAALPSMSDPLIENGLWDGVGKIPNQIESVKGLDFIDGVPQNFGASIEQFTNNLFDGGFKMPQFGQQQQNQRPAAIMRQIKPMGKNASETVVDAPYSQPDIGQQENLTPEEMWKREVVRRHLQRGY